MAKAQLEENPQPLEVAVAAFGSWFKNQNPDFVWSYGAAFDIPVYDAAVLVLGAQVPWDYRKVRDTRTLFGLTNFNPRDVPFEGTKHNALSDAIHQAKCVQLALNMYRRGK
jgi:inhibitor of KinA sporulation pathway (predicted exonuclease)